MKQSEQPPPNDRPEKRQPGVTAKVYPKKQPCKIAHVELRTQQHAFVAWLAEQVLDQIEAVLTQEHPGSEVLWIGLGRLNGQLFVGATVQKRN